MQPKPRRTLWAEPLESRLMLTADAQVSAEVSCDTAVASFDNGVASVFAAPGDANQDGRFDQLDIIQVLQEGKYLTGERADWTEGDWNGDALFDQHDVVLALQAVNYSELRYAAKPQSGRIVERPFRVQATGVMVIDLTSGSLKSTESGQATHLGRFANEGSGMFSLATGEISGTGTLTASNGERLFWKGTTATTTQGRVRTITFTGGTGRFEDASGGFIDVSTSQDVIVNTATKTMTVTTSYTATGTIRY